MRLSGAATSGTLKPRAISYVRHPRIAGIFLTSRSLVETSRWLSDAGWSPRRSDVYIAAPSVTMTSVDAHGAHSDFARLARSPPPRPAQPQLLITLPAEKPEEGYGHEKILLRI